MERKKKPFRDSRESRKPRTLQEPRELPDDVLVGRTAVTEALKSGRGINKILLAQGDRAHDIEELLALAKERGVLTQTVERAKIESLAGGHRHQGVLAFVAPVPYVEVEDILARAEAKGEPPFLLLLDELEDPHNLGAIIRTAETAGADGVITSIGVTKGASVQTGDALCTIK